MGVFSRFKKITRLWALPDVLALKQIEPNVEARH